MQSTHSLSNKGDIHSDKNNATNRSGSATDKTSEQEASEKQYARPIEEEDSEFS